MSLLMSPNGTSQLLRVDLASSGLLDPSRFRLAVAGAVVIAAGVMCAMDLDQVTE